MLQKEISEMKTTFHGKRFGAKVKVETKSDNEEDKSKFRKRK